MPPTPLRPPSVRAALGALALAVLLVPAPAVPVSGEIAIGIEYALVNDGPRVRRLAQAFAGTGATAAKHYPEHVAWGEMQRGPGAPIDFRRLDAFVREFQAAGFRELVVCLKPHSRWASVHHGWLGSRHPAPKPRYLDDFARWIGAVVERYDGDGRDDMPGLRLPVRIYEIGSEFSSYEPEPPEAYLTMLEAAYRAAHAAYPEVRVAHAAFLTTGVFDHDPGPGAYEAAFAAAPERIHRHHPLEDLRKVLDRPDLFDLANFHALGDPMEIERAARWLRWEMDRRGYRKPLIVSDTATTPLIAWGPATVCDRPPQRMGLVIHPATEADRCRLAAYFRRLVDGDPEVVAWTHGFAATDVVKKVVVAAEQEVELIDTAFMEDLSWFKLGPMQAGTGPSAWSGMVDLARGERRPAWHALRQVAGFLASYDAVRRLPAGDPRVRLYAVEEGGERRFVAWLEPERVVLPGEPLPRAPLSVATGGALLRAEPTVTAAGPGSPRSFPVPVVAGRASLPVTPIPVFLQPER